MCNHSKRVKIIIGTTVLFTLCALAWFVVSIVFGGPLAGDRRHDFGVVFIDRPSTVLEHTFRLKNQTDHTLQLVKASPTCGCTTTDWPNDPVLSGEDLVIPVHLKLQKSQLRKSQIRLIFASGEETTLFIEGTGRFKQPLSCSPPSFTLSKHDTEGVRGVLKLEWFGAGRPPEPDVKVPEGIRVTFDPWLHSKAADANRGTPEFWTSLIYVFLEGEIVGEHVIGITIADHPKFDIQCTVNPSD